MQKQGKLELTWVGKYDEKVVEPRILIEDKEKSYGDPRSENMLIHGDNLIALQALQQDFAGKIKCIYIDPPYNTGSAFEQYDDSVEHSIWLSLMKERLYLLRTLLTDDGSIWITLDDSEYHYLKVLCDEIFGRSNYVGTTIWQHSVQGKGYGGGFSLSHNYTMVYGKSLEFHVGLLARTEEHNRNYSNPDNDPKGPWRPCDVRNSLYRPNLMYDITTPSGNVIHYPPNGWRFSKETFEKELAEGKIVFSADEKRIIRKIYLCDQVGRVPDTIWLSTEVGDTREAKNEVKALFPNDAFSTPKPERLIERVLTLASQTGDYILDSFLGSGTTAAVAHKMGRKYIGIEMGEHCYTHCKVRLDKVIDGEQGGISKAVDWQGGGGYHFYELAPSLLVKNKKLPLYQINPEYTFEMLCEAVCKLEGFHYKPNGNFHGYSSERRFIHITKEFINAEYIKAVATSLGENQSLLIYGTRIQSDLRLPDNIEVKRIPKDLLDKCDFESEAR